VRGDSRQDLYAKALALLGLGVLAGAGALVDYWPADLDVPRAASALVRPSRSHALPVPSSVPVLAALHTSTSSGRGAIGRAAFVTADAVTPILSAAAQGGVVLAPPPALSVAPVPVHAAPAEPVALSAPEPLALDDESDDVFDAPVRQFSSAPTTDDSFFLTEAFKTAGGSIANAGGSIVNVGVKTGQSVADAFRAAAGAVRKLKFFDVR